MHRWPLVASRNPQNKKLDNASTSANRGRVNSPECKLLVFDFQFMSSKLERLSTGSSTMYSGRCIPDWHNRKRRTTNQPTMLCHGPRAKPHAPGSKLKRLVPRVLLPPAQRFGTARGACCAHLLSNVISNAISNMQVLTSSRLP